MYSQKRIDPLIVDIHKRVCLNQEILRHVTLNAVTDVSIIGHH